MSELPRRSWMIHEAYPVAEGPLIEVVPAPCGLCGGYGAINDVTHKPVPCMACGKASEGLVLTYVESVSLSREEAQEIGQRAGLRLIKGGPDGA